MGLSGVSEGFLAVGRSVGGALVRGRPEVFLEVGFVLVSEDLFELAEKNFIGTNERARREDFVPGMVVRRLVGVGR